ncbi:hypothetical protein SLA2020_497460 [Shorea laevis]
MAATTTTTSTITTSQLKGHTQPIKPKRRKCKETAISSPPSAAEFSSSGHSSRKLDPPTVVSPDNSWCCSASRPITNPTPPPPYPPVQSRRAPVNPNQETVPTDSSSSFRPPANHSPVMDFTGTTTLTNGHSPSRFTKFNSALTAGLLNPMSPPPPPPPDKTRASPTLLEMMASEPDVHPRTLNQEQLPISAPRPQRHPPQMIDKQALTMQRISDLLSTRSPGNQFNDWGSSDIKLTLSSKDGISVPISVHRQILVAHSRFFGVKLSDGLAKQQRPGPGPPYVVEIADCDDVEVYIETLMLMYCKDLRKKLMREDVSRVLGILKVSAAIGFDAGVLSCLEYLEAAPWAEDEEEKVASLLAELHLENVGAGEVLKRVSIEVSNGTEDGNDNEEVLLKLLHVVLEGKDEKARREMKGLVFRMLHESSSQNDLRKESLYLACEGCLQLLRHNFLQAAASDLQDVGQIARQADNLHWILDILIDRQIAEDFLKTWASQLELSDAHSKVPAVHRYEVSRVTARLFVGIGKGQLLASKDEILLAWFDRFLNSAEDCPNIQRGFEVWWRRAFWRRSGEQDGPRQLRSTTTITENS